MSARGFQKMYFFKNQKEYFVLLSLIPFIILAIAFNSRAFLVGYIVAFIILFLDITKLKKLFKAGLLFAFLSFLYCTIFLIKTDSSLGRIFIYKTSFLLLKKHWVSGVGFRNFPYFYNECQQQYFRTGSYTTKELILADNVKYVYNDYFQFILETGLIGWVAIMVFIYLFFRLRIHILNCRSAYPGIVIFFISQLISFCVAAFFRPVFYNYFFLAVFIGFVGFICYYILTPKLKWASLIILSALFVTVFTVRFNVYIYNCKNYQKYQEARQLSNLGYLNESLITFNSLYSFFYNDVDFISDYANGLMNANKFKEAANILENAKKISYTPSLFVKLGDCYYNLSDYKKAEDAYLTAINIVPNRFLQRMSLFEFYKKTKQNGKLRATGRNILNLPVKIPSFQIEYIQKNVRKQLQETR